MTVHPRDFFFSDFFLSDLSLLSQKIEVGASLLVHNSKLNALQVEVFFLYLFMVVL